MASELPHRRPGISENWMMENFETLEGLFPANSGLKPPPPKKLNLRIFSKPTYNRKHKSVLSYNNTSIDQTGFDHGK